MRRCKYCDHFIWFWQDYEIVNGIFYHNSCEKIWNDASKHMEKMFNELVKIYGYPTFEELMIGYKIIDGIPCYLIKVDDFRMYSRPGE